MGKKSGGNEAALARQDEQERQARIREGTQRINNIFNGGTYGSGAITAGSAYDPSKTYYNADGSVWTPGSGGAASNLIYGLDSAGGNGNDYASLVKAGKLFSGTASSTGFNDDFFKGRREAYSGYATPQLEDQYGDANKELTFALARAGQLNSSARGQKAGELQQLYDLNKQEIGDKALSYETQARTAVEDARGNLISTLNATGDAEGAASSALARSAALTQPAAYSPLGQLFADFTNGLGVQAAQERSYAAGGPAPRYDTGLFGGRGRVVNRS